ncbi:hypothetical protein BDW75DRAFT_239203 [Aspergillus navahoensis]
MTELSNYIALFAVQQNTSDILKQLNLYGNGGFAVDGRVGKSSNATPAEYNQDAENAALEDGYELPDEWFVARGVQRQGLSAAVAIRLPADLYMHVWLYSWNNLDTRAQWPPKFNQIGSRELTLLFDDVEQEIARITRNFPETRILHQPIDIKRKWGVTRSALVLDPDGNFVELISIVGNPLIAKAKPALPHHRSFLHFMINCLDFEKMSPWYQAFGMTHDSGVDFRPDMGFPTGYDHFMGQMKVFTHGEGNKDPSHMHLELLGYQDNGKYLKDPGLEPTWFQKGITRYCMKTPTFEDAQRMAIDRGYKIYIDEQRGCLNWRDSVWFYFGDVDGNILTLEQWHPHRYWCERN